MTYSVLIVDDDAGMRTRIRQLVGEVVPGVVCAAVGKAQDACELVRSVSWQLAVIDLQLPDRSGLAVIHAILATRAGTHVIATSSLPTESYEPLALRAGAHVFVAKEQIEARLPALLRERGDWLDD